LPTCASPPLRSSMVALIHTNSFLSMVPLLSGCTRTLNYQQLYTVSLQPPTGPLLFSFSFTIYGSSASCLVCSATPVKPLGSPEGVYHFLPLLYYPYGLYNRIRVLPYNLSSSSMIPLPPPRFSMEQ
jgi:hypothetical protein